jgi:hypothetical protein
VSDKAALSDVRRRLRQRCCLEADYQPQGAWRRARGFSARRWRSVGPSAGRGRATARPLLGGAELSDSVAELLRGHGMALFGYRSSVKNGALVGGAAIEGYVVGFSWGQPASLGEAIAARGARLPSRGAGAGTHERITLEAKKQA